MAVRKYKVDYRTGEIKGRTRSEFCLMFNTRLEGLTGLSAKGLLVFLSFTNFMLKNNQVELSAEKRLWLCEQLSVKSNHITHCISELVAGDLIRRVNRSVYMVNPVYAAKCNLWQREELKEKYFSLSQNKNEAII